MAPRIQPERTQPPPSALFRAASRRFRLCACLLSTSNGPSASSGLAPHPEGGFYRETFRSAATTLIYYLLPAREFSAFHRVLGRDEVWHHYAGGAIVLHVVHPDGRYETHRLDRGRHHAVVPADAWQAAETDGEAVLVGCTVSPAFDFAAFQLPPRDELRALLAGSALPDDVLVRLTRG